MQNTEGERLRSYLNETGRSQKILTEITGIRKENVSDWMLGKKSIPTKHLRAICKAFADLNCNWVLTGEGEMFYKTIENNVSNGFVCEFTEKIREAIFKQAEAREDEIAALKMALKAQGELIEKYRRDLENGAVHSH